MGDYPRLLVPVNHVEPVPRRIRATLDGQVVLDTTRARYVWERPNYPQYYIPVADVNTDLLGELVGNGAARVFGDDALEGLAGTVRFTWNALDAWFEEDEQVFVHPRSPYTRVDALRSTRTVRIEVDGTVLAESSSPVMVFETGLPTRYYLNRMDIRFEHLVASETVTACPYKGTTSGYWSAQVGGVVYRDLAWAYDFPTRQLLPIAGLIAFYNERVDITVDGVPLVRPTAD
jgi:uncharacterized protein (DUF427 family)